MNIWTNSLTYFALIAALAFGMAYNWFYERNRQIARMYTAFAVALGCAVLLLISAYFIGLLEVLFLAALFTAAGIPMIVGDMRRAYAEQQKELKDEIKRLKDRRGPRDWPNHAKEVRDDTAEELNQLAVKLAALQGEKDPQKLQTYLNHSLVVLHTSLRRLESVGAPTQPPTP